jgi:hypothetical protein
MEVDFNYGALDKLVHERIHSSAGWMFNLTVQKQAVHHRDRLKQVKGTKT